MFNSSPENSRPSGFELGSYSFSNQSSSRFDYGANLGSSSVTRSHNHDGEHFLNDLEGMDWATSSSSAEQEYRHDRPEPQMRTEQDDMDLEALASSSRLGGVGRLVAHFENKGLNPFDRKDFRSSSLLPSRPMNSAGHEYGTERQGPHYAAPRPPLNINSFQPGLELTDFTYAPDRCDGGGDASSLGPNINLSPAVTPHDSWGSLTSLHRFASPGSSRVAASSSPMSPPSISFGGFPETKGASPVATSSSDQFGSLDQLISPKRMRSSVAHTPIQNSYAQCSPRTTASLSATTIASASPVVAGSSSSTIWRPPVSASTDGKPNRPPSSLSFLPETSDVNAYRFNGYDQNQNNINWTSSCSGNKRDMSSKSVSIVKPPLPTKPKPKMNFGSQSNPETQQGGKGKGAAPADIALPCTTSFVSPAYTPKVKQEPDNSGPFHVPAASSSVFSFPLFDAKTEQNPARGQIGTRPSREQVPAEAWEQYKGIIRGLYLEERKPLKEVIAIMADKYRFQATPKMYKTRFSQWGFVKNNTEEEVKRLLSMKFQRDAEGKVSEFVRNGRVVNLGTYLKRKGVTEYDLVDFQLPANLPAHVRCRTPTPPPAPGYLQSPDLLRAQELVVSNMRRMFLHCRQFETETDTCIGWPITMVWGAASSELLLEANFFFEARDADQGGLTSLKAFKALEVDLKKLSPLGIVEVLLGMVNRDPGMMTALCKYLAAYSSTNFERSHPLRQMFTCLYEVQQKHGPSTLSELLWGGIPSIAEELEGIFSCRHPYVARTWIDLALFYNHTDPERFERLAGELRLLQRQVEQRFGMNSADALTLRYSILQLLYAAGPASDATKDAAHELWSYMKSMGVVFGIRDAKPNVYCYHCPVKVDPWTKRCRRRYDSGVSILEEHVGVRLQPYFEEDFHHAVHVPDAQEAWSSAINHMGSARFAFI